MSGITNQFDNINDIINLVTFAVSGIAVGAFIMKFRLQGLDPLAIVILATYLTKNAVCIIVDEHLYSILDYITPITSTVIFAVLLYFVLEMSYIRAAIEENNLADYQKQK